jgi:hypothetical protein
MDFVHNGQEIFFTGVIDHAPPIFYGRFQALA